MLPYGRQTLDADDIAAVLETLQSAWLTQGPKVPAFEQEVSRVCEVKHAVAVNSATSALHIACLALGVDSADRVWTSANSFVASANCARYCGATVDFVDIVPETGNMCAEVLAKKLVVAARNQTLPKVVIPVHFAGQSCDMQHIHNLSQQYGFRIIEDASHAIGGRYQATPIGACEYSDICVFSFHPVKIITTAEGGIATTNDPALAKRMSMLRSHGITADTTDFEGESHGPWYYQQQLLGFNYRMTDLQAALGLSQLTKLSQFVTERQKMAAYYDNAFKHSTTIFPLTQHPDRYSSYHLYIVRLPTLTPMQHKECIRYLRQQGIIGHVHYIPIYLQPYYQQLGFKPGYCENAERYYYQAVTLPLYPGLTEQQQQVVIDTLERFCVRYR